ncbi:MAG: hypothetical protein ACREP9_03785, partial [Candidatus Dormibacteraceae bacterium]
MLPLPSLPDPDLLTDPFGWLAGSLIHAIFGQAGDPRAGLDSLLATFFCVGQSANPFRLENMCRRCADAYAQLRGLGIFALSVAVMARMVILALRYRREGSSPVHFLADIGVRLGLGIGALQVTFWLLSWLAEQSMAVASGVMQLLSKVLLGWGNQGLEHIASNVVGQIAQSTVGGGGNSQLSISLCILLLTAYVGYLVIMVVVSRAAIIFTILAAPLAVPALVFSEDSHVGGLWLRMLLFAAAVPMVAVLCLTLT